ncbi:carboxylate-amine ligase [Lignipirellula cremea]|uniref:Carboxylate-amine ligase YbdK n=1 Tax=Lignipirellula cremea TaxID=2528010 RepID=A0A518DS50_9BACT|nr:glutamate-cysteine ligase family protein [Lignipirellula cremea]QDU94665.1 Carboxylate-amine ligase YbdK [Lignipirellula cremea]
MSRNTLGLFEAYGIELEYMIVGAESLSTAALSDQVLKAIAGSYESEVELGPISWSNELALHVIELKTTGPAPDLAPLPALFQENVVHINRLLAPLGARLMPTAMHPWMDPLTELQLWPHDYNAVYEAFNRIFDCRGHGWANLQSVHINLPFNGDEEFGRLHAAIRLLLPILPALAASSPLKEGVATGLCDTRLEVYRHNARAVPSISGQVIPEPAFTRAAYDELIFRRIYADIAPHDPQGELQHEWLNARGAIARFDRQAIEIRVLDIQECPAADLAICTAIVRVLQQLTDERWASLADQQAVATEPLAQLFQAVVRNGEQTRITNADYLRMWGREESQLTAGQLWRELLDQIDPPQVVDAQGAFPLEVILKEGVLARRILARLQNVLSTDRLHEVYGELCECLADGHMFRKSR